MKTTPKSQGRFLLAFEEPFPTAAGPVSTLEFESLDTAAVMIQILSHLSKLSGVGPFARLSAVALAVPDGTSVEYVILASGSPSVTINGVNALQNAQAELDIQVGPNGEDAIALQIADIYGRSVHLHFAHTMSAYVVIDMLAALGKIRNLNRYSTITAVLGGSMAIPLMAQDPAIRTSTTDIIRQDRITHSNSTEPSIASGDAITVRSSHVKS